MTGLKSESRLKMALLGVNLFWSKPPNVRDAGTPLSPAQRLALSTSFAKGGCPTIRSTSCIPVAVTRNQALVLHHTVKEGRLICVGEVRGNDTQTEHPQPVLRTVDHRHRLMRHHDLCAQVHVVIAVHACSGESKVGIETKRIFAYLLPGRRFIGKEKTASFGATYGCCYPPNQPLSSRSLCSLRNSIHTLRPRPPSQAFALCYDWANSLPSQPALPITQVSSLFVLGNTDTH